MILVYEKDPAAAAAMVRALSQHGHEVRTLETYVGAKDRALELRPRAVVFGLDENSQFTFGALRLALDPERIPVVATGTRSELYRAFRRLRAFGGVFAPRGGAAPERFWAIEAPASSAAACDAVERAIRQAAALPGPGAARSRRPGALALVVIAACGVVGVLASIAMQMVGRPNARAHVASMLLLFAAFAADHGGRFIAARRLGLRPPAWAVAWLTLLAAIVVGQAVQLVWFWGR